LSDARRQQIAEFYRAYGGGRVETLLENFADDAQYVGLSGGEVFPSLGYRRGRDAIAGTMKSLRANYEFDAVRPVSIAIDGDNAAVIALALFRRRTMATTTELFLAHFLRFRDGHIVEFREYVDAADAVQRALESETGASDASPRSA
jgi:ketosteroid isomerase-like protein